MNYCLLLPLLIFGAGDTPGVSGPPGWHNSYAKAMAAAKASNTMMVVYFYDGQKSVRDDYVYKLLTTDQDLVVASKPCTMAYVPTGYTASVGGKEMRLLDHPGCWIIPLFQSCDEGRGSCSLISVIRSLSIMGMWLLSTRYLSGRYTICLIPSIRTIFCSSSSSRELLLVREL